MMLPNERGLFVVAYVEGASVPFMRHHADDDAEVERWLVVLKVPGVVRVVVYQGDPGAPPVYAPALALVDWSPVAA